MSRRRISRGRQVANAHFATEILLHDYLRPTPIIDCDHPAIRERAALLCDASNTMRTIARCFEWVRDEIRHSIDFGDEQVTLIASDVLLQGTGLCYAKSHLLAALLRANEIPCGLVYQRLADEGSPSGFCLHGLNAVWIPELRWFRIDARGNRPHRTTCFAPPTESLAFMADQPGEFTGDEVFLDPLPVVLETLSRYQQVSTLCAHLPDIRNPHGQD